ncbi:hypothetical protein ACH47B_06735 [Rhodococcus sp. NPDC019627]|uniref:hypothetical protein n=1 Tax=unclassified Rhodococcus (in: high G+C Gram-positive bacteria) TaxID=192944 RepID=UPI0037B9E5EF
MTARHESVRRARLAELLAGTFARAGREVVEALDVVGARVSADDVEQILGDACDGLLLGVDVAGFHEADTVDPDAALDAARDARDGVL